MPRFGDEGRTAQEWTMDPQFKEVEKPNNKICQLSPFRISFSNILYSNDFDPFCQQKLSPAVLSANQQYMVSFPLKKNLKFAARELYS